MSRFLQIEKEMLSFLKTIPVGVTPGLQIQAIQKGQRVLDVRWGETYAYYDLASLTKPLFTTLACAYAFEKLNLDLDQEVKTYDLEFPYTGVTVKSLLNHTSHLPAYAPFYKSMAPQPTKENYHKLLQQAFELPLEVSQKAIYSDIGFWVLGKVLEIKFEKPLIEIWKTIQAYFYPHIEGLHFCVNNKPKYASDSYAPTARCPWRERLIQGEVHDEHAFLMEGVAPHAGLFGSIDDVMWAMLSVRAQIIGIGRKLLKQKTSQIFFERSIPPSQGDWALGFMLPTEGASSAGKYFSLSSVGHLGFTGVSTWFDPSQDLIVTILSNRAFYGRDNKDFNQWRPLLHDKTVELLRRY
jgi:CubicO group peptidase (beta-lactamase class C family)